METDILRACYRYRIYQRLEKNGRRRTIKDTLKWESIDYTEVHLSTGNSVINQ